MEEKVFLESEVKMFANTDIAIKDTATEEQKKQIENIFDEIYGDCYEYIQKIEGLHYRGDMGCLSVLGSEAEDVLEEKNLMSLITKFDLVLEGIDHKESMLE